MAVRKMLYICAVGHSRRDGEMDRFYRRLIQQGKHAKGRAHCRDAELVILANTLIAQDRCWQPAKP